MKITIHKIAFIILLFFFSFTVPDIAHAQFFKGVIFLYKNKVSHAEVENIAKYDISVLNRFTTDHNNILLHKTIKRINKNNTVFIYQLGSETNINQDNYQIKYLNSIGRYGFLKKHNSDLFLKDSKGSDIINPSYPNSVVMKFGSSEYQDFWVKATLSDIYFQSWRADGIFIDTGMIALEEKGKSPYGGDYPINSAYSNAAAWNSSMVDFINAASAGLRAKGQKIFANRGLTRYRNGYDAWIALDQSAVVPDIVLEEGAFSVHWGANDDVQFFGEQEWKRQVDIVGQINNSEIALLSHTDLSPDKLSGKDNFGKPVTFWQVLWYSLCSYHLARKDDPNNSYFMFRSKGYKTTWWFDEYDKIDLGKALGRYETRAVSGTTLYFREFEQGYILVNPTIIDIPSFQLPKKCAQRTHANLSTDTSKLPILSAVAIPAHHGVVCQIPSSAENDAGENY